MAASQTEQGSQGEKYEFNVQTDSNGEIVSVSVIIDGKEVSTLENLPTEIKEKLTARIQHLKSLREASKDAPPRKMGGI